ncbi:MULTISPECIES: alpha/beta fold hydrolase [Clostridium]|uniref:alpha/beta fold hydrolase n=1 Tax=Clostridium TaxID=1485 RepID=UPI0008268B59|nr:MULTISPECIES: alpha/beta hydrolase [Clostridium]PJI07546.1 alpha/beta hydrolase [Clostridium sp. CT7]
MLHYVQIGNKKSADTLLFVHGSGNTYKIFGEVYKHLTNYNCILIDLNGHGESKGECSSTLEGYADNVIDFIKNSNSTRNQNKITLIGYSLGGSIVLSIALKKLPNIKQAIIISGASKFDKLKDIKAMKELHKSGKIDIDFFNKCMSNQPNPLVYKYMHISKSDPKVSINDLAICENLDISNKIKDIDIPVKIIIARDEISVLLKYAERDNAKIKNSTLTIFENGRHFLLVVHGKEVAKEIAGFVSG